MKRAIEMRSRVAASKTFVLLLAATLLAAGCASSNKLAQKSQAQLAEGEVRKAYATALKAIAKDPYNGNAISALRACGNAVLEYDARRFRSLAPMDTIAAAEVALAMDELRYETAQYGVTLHSDARLADEEARVRTSAAAQLVDEGESLLEDRRPKAAYAEFERARSFRPNDTSIVERLARTRELAVDRVLLLPYANDTRARIDSRELSWDMYRHVKDEAGDRLPFTRLEDPETVWAELFGYGPGRFASEAAYGIAEQHDATRVAWARIYGDRIESHSETFHGMVYRKELAPQPDGSTVTRWREIPVIVRIEDRWVSVAVECEVHQIENRKLIARRSADRGAGWRAVMTTADLTGDPRDYALYTPEQWNTERDACKTRTRAWSEALGTLDVETLVRSSRGRAGTLQVRGTGATSYGSIRRSGESYRVGYGRLPGESMLLEGALQDAWKEVLATLEVSDRT
ncbi:MAG: hypothetical protein ACREOU_16125 [Candidatus Eiseniibacteriota bacterium]